MLFAGGQAEVANLVAKAIASRSGSPATGCRCPARPPAATAPAASQGHAGGHAGRARPGSRWRPTTEVNRPVAPPAATASSADGDFGDRMGRLTPPPVTPYPPMRGDDRLAPDRPADGRHRGAAHAARRHRR